MKKQVITEESILKFLKRGFKNKIVEIMEFAPLSKQMIGCYLFIPEHYLSEYLNELLEEKKIFEIGLHYCKVSKTQQPIYGSEELLTFFNSFENGK